VPDVVAQDASKTLAPYDYIILTKMPGKMVYASRDEVTPEQVHDIAYAAGMHLAAMHEHSFDGFGLLFNLAAGVSKAAWADYVAYFYADYAGQVRATGLLDEAILARIEAVQKRMSPLFAAVTRGHFVHGDYHYANLLQENGQLSGVLDFEWAMSGDPAWDFRIDDQLELALLGSKAAFYAGYTARRALDGHHAERVAFYKLGLYLDYLTFEDESEHDETRSWLLKELEWLESRLPE
jgi:aminoglycoside phosphotransferase (APT) family kinase protein